MAGGRRGRGRAGFLWLYHYTSLNNAESIWRTGCLRACDGSERGFGVYFTELDPEAGRQAIVKNNWPGKNPLSPEMQAKTECCLALPLSPNHRLKKEKVSRNVYVLKSHLNLRAELIEKAVLIHVNTLLQIDTKSWVQRYFDMDLESYCEMCLQSGREAQWPWGYPELQQIPQWGIPQHPAWLPPQELADNVAHGQMPANMLWPQFGSWMPADCDESFAAQNEFEPRNRKQRKRKLSGKFRPPKKVKIEAEEASSWTIPSPPSLSQYAPEAPHSPSGSTGATEPSTDRDDLLLNGEDDHEHSTVYTSLDINELEAAILEYDQEEQQQQEHEGQDKAGDCQKSCDGGSERKGDTREPSIESKEVLDDIANGSNNALSVPKTNPVSEDSSGVASLSKESPQRESQDHKYK